MLECIRWPNVPLKDSVVAASWPELGLAATDPDFLVRQSQAADSAPPVPHDAVLPDLLRGNYSANR